MEGLQSKVVMMKAERDKLIDISNELRVELNKLKKQQQQQSPKKETAVKSYKEKLEKLKQNYNNLDQLEAEDDI